jgi:hypothetical protein
MNIFRLLCLVLFLSALFVQEVEAKKEKKVAKCDGGCSEKKDCDCKKKGEKCPNCHKKKCSCHDEDGDDDDDDSDDL